ncbi:hypothetical protein Tco_1235370 [Tanacetum coccineum]
MDDPNITMEEYIILEEEKSQRHAIVFDNTLTSDTTLLCAPTVSPPNKNKIDFRISLDESDDEDYTVIFDENSFSYKIIYVNDLKRDSENDEILNHSSSELTVDCLDDLDCFKDFENEFPAIIYNDGLTSKSDLEIEPPVSYGHINKFETSLSKYDEEERNALHVTLPDNLKTIKDGDDNIDITQPSGCNKIKRSNKLPRKIHDKTKKVFNENFFIIILDADIVSGSHINWMPFNLIKNLYVPFGIPFDPKRYYKDDAHTRMLRRPRFSPNLSLYDVSIIMDTAYRLRSLQMWHMAPLPHRDLRHLWLRYQVDGYDEGIVHSYEQRLETIWSRPVNRVHVLDFAGLTPEMRLRMVYTRGEGQQVFVSYAWRRLFRIRAPLVREFILDFLSTCRMSDTEMGLDVADTLWIIGLRSRLTETSWGPAPSYVLIRDPVRRLCHRMIAYSISGRGQAPEKVTGVDLFYLCSMDRGTTNVPHLLAQYLFRHAEGRKSGARLSGEHFIWGLAMHFGLVSDEGLRGLQVVTRELPLIDLHELGRLNICSRFGDTWAWVAPGLERQQVAAAGAHEADEAGPAVDEGAQDVPAPAQAPPPPPPAP